MKRLVYFLPILCLIFNLASCSDDDDVVVKHKATVTVALPSEVKAADVTSLSVTALNVTTGESVSVPVVLPALTVNMELVQGTYNFTVTGKTADFNINGVTAGVEMFADKDVTVSAIAAVESSIILKEVYFSGVPDFYFQDQFYELYNNTDEVQYLDGIILGVVDFGMAPGTYTKDQPSVWMTNGKYTDSRYPLTSHVQCFPGNGTDYPIQPRTSVIVAANPINHSARTLSEADKPSPVDLSNAQWQLYTDNTIPADTKIDGIPAMTFLWKTWGREMMPATDGEPIILAKLKNGTKPEDYVADAASIGTIPGGSSQCLMIPADCIIDAIDIVPASNDCHYKRIEAKDDAGMVWFTAADGVSNGEYSGRSLRRKVAGFTADGKVIYKDTNNSSNDFIIGGVTPTPGVFSTVVE